MGSTDVFALVLFMTTFDIFVMLYNAILTWLVSV